jgi:hypothetical protein
MVAAWNPVFTHSTEGNYCIISNGRVKYRMGIDHKHAYTFCVKHLLCVKNYNYGDVEKL